MQILVLCYLMLLPRFPLMAGMALLSNMLLIGHCNCSLLKKYFLSKMLLLLMNTVLLLHLWLFVALPFLLHWRYFMNCVWNQETVTTWELIIVEYWPLSFIHFNIKHSPGTLGSSSICYGSNEHKWNWRNHGPLWCIKITLIFPGAARTITARYLSSDGNVLGQCGVLESIWHSWSEIFSFISR